MKDALILSGDESLFSVIFCELSFMGYSAGDTCEQSCRVLFCDADSETVFEKRKSVRYKKLVLISRTPEKIKNTKADAVLLRPIRSSELRKLADELLSNGEKKPAEPTPRKKSISVDKTARTVAVGQRKIRLSEKEFFIFCELFENREKTVLRETLAKKIDARGGNEVDVYICYLRRKLETDGKRMIFTERGVGYYLK